MEPSVKQKDTISQSRINIVKKTRKDSSEQKKRKGARKSVQKEISTFIQATLMISHV